MRGGDERREIGGEEERRRGGTNGIQVNAQRSIVIYWL
jgi:hypothetical protein